MEMENTPESSPNTFKKLQLWTEKDTKRLMDLHKEYLPQIGPLKRFKNKKDMWSNIANEYPGKSPKQCEERYKTVLKRKRPKIEPCYVAMSPDTKSFKIVTASESEDGGNDNEKYDLPIDSSEPRQITTSELIIKNEFKDEEEENYSDEDESLLEEMRSGDETSSNWFKSVNVWSSAETNLLLKLYNQFLQEIGPLKRFKSKREMWLHMANEIPGKSSKQCETRYKTVLKRKRFAAENRQQQEVASAMAKGHHTNGTDDKSLHADDEGEEEENNETEAHQGNNSKKYKTVQETLLEIAARREEAKERRHKEKLEVVNKMLHILEQILVDKNK